MSDPRAVAEAVADAMADGQAVDWDGVGRRLATAPGTDLVRDLRILQRLDGVRGEESVRVASDTPVRLPFRLLLVGSVAYDLAGIVGSALAAADRRPVPSGLCAAVLLAFCAAGVGLAMRGGDRRARTLGMLFLLIASAFAKRFLGWLSQVPGGAWIPPLKPEVFFPLFLWLFVRDFPRTVRLSRSDSVSRAGIWISAATAVLLLLGNVGVVAPAWLASWISWQRLEGDAYWLALVGISLPALAVAWHRRRFAPLRERRRVTLFMAALLAGLGPMLVEIAAEILLPGFDAWISRPDARWAGAWVLLVPLISIPFSTAYAVTAHRVLPVAHVAHRALGYGLARATLLLLVLAPLALLSVLLYRSQDMTIGQLLRTGQSVALASCAVLSAALLVAREPLSRRLAHAFHESDADLHTATASLGERLLGIGTSTELARLVATDVSRVLAVEGAALLVENPNAASFEAALGDHLPLASDSALVHLAAAGDGPLNVDPDFTRSAFRLLPRLDREWVAQSGCCALVPLRGPIGNLKGILAVRAKLSDAPLNREESLFLRGISAPVAMGLARCGDTLVVAEDTVALHCRACGAVQRERATCAACGGPLEPAALPSMLFGKFTVDRLLGRGGMGLVYLGTDLALGRQIAIKTLPRLGTDTALGLRREARAMASLNHPNVAGVHGLEAWNGRPLLIVEFLSGGTLLDRLREGPLDADRVLEVGVSLASALDALHSKGILHGDVKPSNVGFTSEGVLKLLDFGLVRGAGPAATASAGTPLYLPPEGFEREEMDARLDLWALAMTLYEALVGRHPFADTSSMDELRDRLARGVPEVRSQRPHTPAPLARWLDAALSRDPRHRPPTATACRAAFVEFLGSSQL